MLTLEKLLDKDKLIRTGRTVVQSVLAAVLVAVLPLLLSGSVNQDELWTAAKVAAVTTVLAYLSPKKTKSDDLSKLKLPKLTEPK